ncbi:MAG TPA: type IV toxin-antitoxin system AbiEi family antitoxin domain-containing protein [Steroidobacteraceae bacterium]|nr:type IV toxin-antitoxin system AbiEi family antitoxin domain-containing protein [Steroidobacteraceae bacterium]
MRTKPPTPDRTGLPPVFTYSEARTAGISAERLYTYRDAGLVEQIGRGLYRWADEPEIDQDLLEVAYRAPRGTLCLVTALARHGLTDIIPERIDIAVPRGSRLPALQSPIHVHVFGKKTFDLGREKIDIGGDFEVGLYSPERSLVDVIRLRHQEGPDVAWDALRRWLRRRGAKPAALIDMAKHFHGAERIVRQALEVVS